MNELNEVNKDGIERAVRPNKQPVQGNEIPAGVSKKADSGSTVREGTSNKGKD